MSTIRYIATASIAALTLFSAQVAAHGDHSHIEEGQAISAEPLV